MVAAALALGAMLMFIVCVSLVTIAEKFPGEEYYHEHTLELVSYYLAHKALEDFCKVSKLVLSKRRQIARRSVSYDSCWYFFLE
jgi:hypothetical protein